MNMKTMALGAYQTNCYILCDEQAKVCAVVDPGGEAERIRLFVESHEDGKAYPNQDFFEWHNKLTGSCLMGREQFAREHEVDLEASMTVREFIKLTENAYGGSTIRKLKEFYP